MFLVAGLNHWLRVLLTNLHFFVITKGTLLFSKPLVFFEYPISQMAKIRKNCDGILCLFNLLTKFKDTKPWNDEGFGRCLIVFLESQSQHLLELKSKYLTIAYAYDFSNWGSVSMLLRKLVILHNTFFVLLVFWGKGVNGRCKTMIRNQITDYTFPIT